MRQLKIIQRSPLMQVFLRVGAANAKPFNRICELKSDCCNEPMPCKNLQPDTFYTKHLLHHTPFTKTFLIRNTFTPNRFFVFLCFFVFVFVFLCLCVCVDLFVFVGLWLCWCVWFCGFVFLCGCVFVFAFLCLCLCLCLCVCYFEYIAQSHCWNAERTVHTTLYHSWNAPPWRCKTQCN